MAGGGMGGMPQGGIGQPGNPMGGQLGMSGGLGMGGLGFGQGPGYGVDNFQPGQGGFAGTPMSNPGIPQGDTFQPQADRQPINMQQISQILRGLQGGQAPQMPQPASMYSAAPSMQQPMTQQPIMTGSAERNWVSQSPYAQQAQQPTQLTAQNANEFFRNLQTPRAAHQQAVSQIGQGAYRELFGKPAAAQSVAQPQQGIAGLRKQSAQGAMDRYLATRGRRR